MEKFYIDDYINRETHKGSDSDQDFRKLCQLIDAEFVKEWDEQKENMYAALDIQKKAIIGYENEVAFFKNKISDLIKKYNAANTEFPKWYESLEDAIYHENWGLSGVAEWFGEAFSESSSAKVIGDRIYFLENGRMKLKEQRITKERRTQLIRAFLLLTPEERINKDFHELYMLDGTRVTIFGGSMVKEDQDVIVFRRYIIPNYTFEEQVSRGTIPREAVALFKEMVGLGYNIAITGAVRTAKTTFLSTWQSYEDDRLEGVMVETDPEVPLHKLMPLAPIVQILADNDKLRNVTKNLLRSDADYVVMAEAREGIALDTAIKIASKGTRRMKITFHTREPLNFPYDVAAEIVKSMGGDIHYTAKKVADSFDYIFHFVQLKDKSQKRLKSIHEIDFDKAEDRISMRQICAFDYATERWQWENLISRGKRIAGMEEDPERFERFKKILAELGEMK